MQRRIGEAAVAPPGVGGSICRDLTSLAAAWSTWPLDGDTESVEVGGHLSYERRRATAMRLLSSSMMGFDANGSLANRA
jgi:hypothetical protein